MTQSPTVAPAAAAASDGGGTAARQEESATHGAAVRTARWFGPWLVVLTGAGIICRIVYSVVWQDGRPLHGDPLFYEQTANQLAHGHGYSSVFFGHGAPVPTALHPPLFSAVLAVLDLVGIDSPDGQRTALAFIASSGIVVMGFVGRRVSGPGVGLVAAAIAAFGPLWIQPGGKVMSESIYLVLIPIVLLTALRCVDRPGLGRFALVGVTIGLAALTRDEALTLVVLLGVPVVLYASRSWADRLRFGITLLAAFALIIGPWLVRNDIQMGGITFSTNSGTTLVGADTSSTFAPDNPEYGSFDGIAQFGSAAVILRYGHPPDHADHWTELTLNNALGHLGTTFARQHLSDLPGVMLAREARLWGLYYSGSELSFDIASDGNGVRSVQEAGQYVNWVLLPLAFLGAVDLYRRRRRDLVILLAPIVATGLMAALTFGSTRYRSLAEPSIALLAAVGTVVLVEQVQRVRRRRATGAEDPEPMPPPEAVDSVGAGAP